MTPGDAVDPGLAAIAFSGGLDSTVAAAHYRSRGHGLLLVTIDHGLRDATEVQATRAIARHFQAEHIIVDLGSLGGALSDDAHMRRSSPFPNRTTVLAGVATAVALSRGAALLALGIHAGDQFANPDCRPEFVEQLRALVQIANSGLHPPRIEAPFLTWSKADLARHGDELDAPLHLTWSCSSSGGSRHCGLCETCYVRREAFLEAGVVDPTEYLDSTPELTTT